MPDEGKPIEHIRARPSFLPLPRRDRSPGGSPPAPQASLAGYQNPLRTPTETRSLFSEILDWMLAPLLLLWPVSLTLTYVGAQSIANVPFDRNLGDSASVLAYHVRDADGQVSLHLPVPAGELLRDDGTDSVYYMVLGARREFVAGDRDLPLPPEDETPLPRAIKYRFDRLRGNEVRLAYIPGGRRMPARTAAGCGCSGTRAARSAEAQAPGARPGSGRTFFEASSAK